MGYLILVRHGESRWNLVDKFTGWVDVPLSQKGLTEAMKTAGRLKNLQLDMAFASHLERAHQTLLPILSQQHCTGIFFHEHEHGKMMYPQRLEKDEIPVHTSWLLNERNYGLLQGMVKTAAARKYGKKKVLAWRRGYEDRPPRGESLSDVYARAVPYYIKKILPEIKKGKNVLVVAHGNVLRTIIKHIDGISDELIADLELAPAQPHMYEYKSGVLKSTSKSHLFTRPLNWS